MTKPTPRPWRAEGDEVYGPALVRINRDGLPSKVGHNGSDVCIVGTFATNTRKTEREANADLIVRAIEFYDKYGPD